jgi:HPt (histidine-containing phosphotransfer) domain-containing protein
MDDYMTKPIRAEALVTLVERIGMAARKDTPSPEGAADVPPPFNLAEALDRVDGDRGLLAEIAGIFLADIPAMLEGVTTAHAAGDATALSRAAHRIKGSVLTFAAGPASEVALALEQMGRTGEIAEADTLVPLLKTELDRLSTSLQSLVEPEQSTRRDSRIA